MTARSAIVCGACTAFACADARAIVDRHRRRIATRTDHDAAIRVGGADPSGIASADPRDESPDDFGRFRHGLGCTDGQKAGSVAKATACPAATKALASDTIGLKWPKPMTHVNRTLTARGPWPHAYCIG